MKKLVALALALLVSAALAQSTAKLLSAVTTTGAGTAIALPPGNKTYQASGSTSEGTGTAVITVQCSGNGANWDTVGTATLTLGTVTTSLSFSSQDRCAQTRGNLTSVSGTSTVNLTAGY